MTAEFVEVEVDVTPLATGGARCGHPRNGGSGSRRRVGGSVPERERRRSECGGRVGRASKAGAWGSRGI